MDRAPLFGILRKLRGGGWWFKSTRSTSSYLVIPETGTQSKLTTIPFTGFSPMSRFPAIFARDHAASFCPARADTSLGSPFAIWPCVGHRAGDSAPGASSIHAAIEA